MHPRNRYTRNGCTPCTLSRCTCFATGTPGTGEKGVPNPGTHLRSKKEEDSKEDTPAAAFVSSAVGKFVTISPPPPPKIIRNCRNYTPDATPEEIAHFCEVKLLQIQRDPSVNNPTALLISSVQEYFHPGSSALSQFRAAQVAEAPAQVEVERWVAERRDWEAKEESIQRQIDDAWPSFVGCGTCRALGTSPDPSQAARSAHDKGRRVKPSLNT